MRSENRIFVDAARVIGELSRTGKVAVDSYVESETHDLEFKAGDGEYPIPGFECNYKQGCKNIVPGSS